MLQTSYWPRGCWIWPWILMWASTGPKTIWHSFLHLTSHVLTCTFLISFIWCIFNPPYRLGLCLEHSCLDPQLVGFVVPDIDFHPAVLPQVRSLTLFCWLFTTKDQYKKACFLRTNYQRFNYFFSTWVSCDIRI